MNDGTAPEASSFDEIRGILAELPGPDVDAAGSVAVREPQLTKPPGSLGVLEDLVAWLATWQGRSPPTVESPRVAVFAGNHGVAARGISAWPPSVTAEMVGNFIAGGAAINQICRTVDAGLRVYEMALDHPVADFTQGPAMTEQECVRAMGYGMMAVEEGIDLLCLGEMGIGNTTSASAVCAALCGGTAANWTGPGTGVSGEVLARKTDTVEDGLVRHAAAFGEPLEILRRLGGLEFAAIFGAIVAARRARVPVLLDGFACTAAAAVLHSLGPALIDHCLVAHVSAEPGHRRLLDWLDRTALFDFRMRLGEGSGAALAVGILRAAVGCHRDMATFAEAGVSDRAN